MEARVAVRLLIRQPPQRAFTFPSARLAILTGSFSVRLALARSSDLRYAFRSLAPAFSVSATFASAWRETSGEFRLSELIRNRCCAKS